MTLRVRRLVWTALTVVGLAVLYRTGWVASHATGGWEILRERLVAGLPPILAEKRNSESRVWFKAKQRLLEEADRVEADPKSTAEDCMGVAWLLKGSTWARRLADPVIVGRMVWCSPPGSPSVEGWHDIDRNLVARAEQLAAKATSLEPERADWWRLRALLMVRAQGYEKIDVEGLRQGLEHDPGNAIYDYLLACEAMNRAFGGKNANDGPVKYIADPDLLAAGQRQYMAATERKSIWCGEGGYRAASDFLSGVDAPMSIKEMWNNPFLFEVATEELARRIESPIDDENLRDLTANEASAIADAISDRVAGVRKWPMQFEMAPETLWLKDYRALPLTNYFDSYYRGRRINSLLAGQETREHLLNGLSIAGVAAMGMAVMFLVLGIFGWVCGAILARRGRAVVGDSSIVGGNSLGWLRAPALFLIVLALTYGFLGLAPAFQPRLSDCPWPIGIGMAVILAVVGWQVARVARFARQQSRLPREQRSSAYQSARVITVICCSLVFLLAFFSLIDPRCRGLFRNFLRDFPDSLASHTRVDYISAGALGANWHGLDFPALEWSARGGAFWTVGITFISLMWVGWQRLQALESKDSRLSGLLKYASDSVLWLAALLLIVSLAITSSWTSNLVDRYKRDLARLGDHAWLVKEADRQAKELELNVSP